MAIQLSTEEKNLWRVVQAVIQLIQGRSNAVGTVTLRNGQTTTTVTKLIDPAAINVALGSKVFLEPETANAAAARATTYISAVGQGTFTITHANAATTDRTFSFHCIG